MSFAAGTEYFPSRSSCNSMGESSWVASMMNVLSSSVKLMGGRRRWAGPSIPLDGSSAGLNSLGT